MLCACYSWPTQTVLHQLQEESDGVPFIGRGRVAGGEQELLGTLCHPFGCWVRRYLNILPGKGWRRLGLCVLGRISTGHQSCSWLCPRHSRHGAADDDIVRNGPKVLYNKLGNSGAAVFLGHPTQRLKRMSMSFCQRTCVHG